MFEFDAAKLFVIGIVALIVIGPKELPRVLRQLGQMIGKMRRMAADFQGQFMDAMRESELDELKKDINKVADSVQIDGGANPFNQLAQDINRQLAENPVAGADAPVEVTNFVPPLPPDVPPVNPADFAMPDPAAFEAPPEPVPAPAAEIPPADILAQQKGQA